MSPRATPKATQDPTEPVVDPLADLRDPEQAGIESLPSAEEPEEETIEAITQEEWDHRRDLAVVAMHEDLTCQGFLHGGGNCGCRFIAGVMLRAVLPVQANQDDAPEGE